MTCWEMVKHWLDPRTQAKIEILGSGPDMLQRLLDFVPPDSLPAHLGGTSSSLVLQQPRDHTEHVSVPRYGATRKVLAVPGGRRLVVDCYTTEGELDLEIFAAPHSAALDRRTPSEAISMAEVNKQRAHPSARGQHLVAKRELKGSQESQQTSQHPLRTVLECAADEHDRVFTLLWTNSSRFYTRPLTFNLLVRDGPKVTIDPADSEVAARGTAAVEAATAMSSSHSTLSQEAVPQDSLLPLDSGCSRL